MSVGGLEFGGRANVPLSQTSAPTRKFHGVFGIVNGALRDLVNISREVNLNPGQSFGRSSSYTFPCYTVKMADIVLPFQSPQQKRHCLESEYAHLWDSFLSYRTHTHSRIRQF